MFKQRQPKKKPKYQSTIKRTLHYFVKTNWRYKWYLVALLITTPIVIFVRQILSPLVIANVIGILSSAKPEDFINPGNILQIPLVQKILPQGIFLFLCQLIGSAVFGNLRVYLVWKMELLTINDLSIQCFDTINNQSMQFHSDRFSGSLTAQVGRFTRAYERFTDQFIFNIIPLIITFTSIFIILMNRAPMFAIGLMFFSLIFAVVSSRSFKKSVNATKKKPPHKLVKLVSLPTQSPIFSRSNPMPKKSMSVLDIPNFKPKHLRLVKLPWLQPFSVMYYSILSFFSLIS